MVNLEKILPTDDDPTYVRHVYLIVIMWVLITGVVALAFAVFTF